MRQWGRHLMIPKVHNHPSEFQVVARFWADAQVDLGHSLISDLPHFWYASNHANQLYLCWQKATLRRADRTLVPVSYTALKTSLPMLNDTSAPC